MQIIVFFAHELSTIMGRAAARSDQKISRQLPQVSARLHQRKRRTVNFLTTNNGVFFLHFKPADVQNTP